MTKKTKDTTSASPESKFDMKGWLVELLDTARKDNEKAFRWGRRMNLMYILFMVAWAAKIFMEISHNISQEHFFVWLAMTVMLGFIGVIAVVTTCAWAMYDYASTVIIDHVQKLTDEIEALKEKK